MRLNKSVVFLLLISIGLLVNYTMPKKIVDQIQLVTAAGYDAMEDEQIRGTVLSSKYSKEGRSIISSIRERRL
ncbi:hypothetical protein MUO14_23870 [Halobacillus shinanisalinarum]|uniref:Uncharacterized protein n=1 Tax=Halobacillus shinanisalinarum TaxID=2932258 RepID=A0ABY4GYU2_9BACI|nr:hypothetical protein [Halobacillus shinanisalinarum]UOQ93370.1 hypothetical protein MUO14_23870 [Halobacillus shinanisalinarum]